MSEVIELVLVVDESCDKLGFISQEAIERTLLFDQIQNCICKFNNIQIQQNQTSVDDAAAELSNIFISATTMSLKRRFKKITDKPRKNGLMQIYIK